MKSELQSWVGNRKKFKKNLKREERKRSGVCEKKIGRTVNESELGLKTKAKYTRTMMFTVCASFMHSFSIFRSIFFCFWFYFYPLFFVVLYKMHCVQRIIIFSLNAHWFWMRTRGHQCKMVSKSNNYCSWIFVRFTVP